MRPRWSVSSTRCCLAGFAPGPFGHQLKVDGFVPNDMKYQFTESDIKRLTEFVKRKSSPQKQTESKENPATPSKRSWQPSKDDYEHYSPPDLAELWGLSVDMLRRIFMTEPGVLKLGTPGTRSRRAYYALRIPQEVALRVHKRLSA